MRRGGSDRAGQGGYTQHTDCGDVSRPPKPFERASTALMYLTSLAAGDGGETVFPRLGLTIRPEAGAALVFHSLAGGRCLAESIHEGAPVRAGAEVDKYILQRWYMRARYPMLGQRPDMHIPLPARSERTARVSCGDGEGQCRWYDEWDPHHLSDFNSWRAQSSL